MKSYLILILILFIFTFIYHIHSQFNNQFKWIQDIDYSSSIISRISISLSSFSFSSMSTHSQYNSISLSSLWTMWIGIGVESDLWTTLSFPTIQWNQLSNHSLWNGFALSSVSSTQRFINTSSIDSHSFICIWDSTSTNHSISIQTDNKVFNGIHLHSCSKWICGSSDWERESLIQGHSSGWYHWFLSQSLIDSSFSISLSISIHSHFTVSLQNRFRLYHQSSSSQFNCWRIERRLCWRLCEWKHLQLSEFKSKELCTQITDRNNDKNRILFNRSWIHDINESITEVIDWISISSFHCS